MKTIRMYVTNYTTLTGIHDGTRAIMSTNDGGGSSTDIIRRRAPSPTQSKSPKFEHCGARNDERRLTPLTNAGQTPVVPQEEVLRMGWEPDRYLHTS